MGFTTLWDDEENDGTEDLSEEDQRRFENDPREFWIKRKYLDKRRKIRYTPAPAHIHFFTYEHCWIGLHRQPYKDAGSPWVANMEKLCIYAAPWRKHVLNVLRDIQDASIEHDNNLSRGLNMGSSFQWMRVASKRPRPLSTIVFDPEQKKRIIKDVQDYIDPRTCSWYQSRGLPYRQGYLFYGAPGTGKSSLCLGITSLVQLDIFMVSLSANDLDENSLALLFQSLPPRCVVLFEDVDQAGIRKRSTDSPLPRKREGTDEEGESDSLEANDHEQRSNSITLAVFLNIIDGVSAQEGRILVMTTNHIEQA